MVVEGVRVFAARSLEATPPRERRGSFLFSPGAKASLIYRGPVYVLLSLNQEVGA
jgi:hypothetical protein